MAHQNEDWKDVASSYYDKCLALTIIFVMFAFIVFPNIETRAIRSSEKIMETIEIPPDIPEQIKPPEEIAQPMVEIEIIDPDDAEDDETVTVVDTIEETMDIFTPPPPPPTVSGDGETPRFVVYEDAPVVTRRVNPVYPEMARRMSIQGTVILDIEVHADGRIGAVEVFRSVMSGPGGLDEAAVTAVRQWQFQPAKSGGSSVACWIKQSIVFNID